MTNSEIANSYRFAFSLLVKLFHLLPSTNSGFAAWEMHQIEINIFGSQALERFIQCLLNISLIRVPQFSSYENVLSLDSWVLYSLAYLLLILIECSSVNVSVTSFERIKHTVVTIFAISLVGPKPKDWDLLTIVHQNRWKFI